MTIDLDTFEAKARAATPGPWEHDGIGYVRPSSDGYAAVARCLPWGKGTAQHADPDFIAAANPAAVLELIAELRELRGLDKRIDALVVFDVKKREREEIAAFLDRYPFVVGASGGPMVKLSDFIRAVGYRQ